MHAPVMWDGIWMCDVRGVQMLQSSEGQLADLFFDLYVGVGHAARRHQVLCPATVHLVCSCCPMSACVRGCSFVLMCNPAIPAPVCISTPGMTPTVRARSQRHQSSPCCLPPRSTTPCSTTHRPPLRARPPRTWTCCWRSWTRAAGGWSPGRNSAAVSGGRTTHMHECPLLHRSRLFVCCLGMSSICLCVHSWSGRTGGGRV